MASPTLWSKTPFFYPIGNTPPVCLTQGLAPEEPADILLLGCGDPRNILETVHFDLGDGRRKLDFTCCDLETAVLARNILLFSAIADGTSWLNAWHIFYHFFIGDASLEVLLSQCRKLIHSSHNLATWNTSSYGKYIRFCTEESMIEIRQKWELYLATNNLSKQEKDGQRNSFFSHMKQIREKYGDEIDLTMVRGAGPINQETSIRVGMQVLRSFWENGFMKGSKTGSTISPHLNPTFAYSLSGSEFNVHYRTNPLSAFHLSPALSPTKGSSSQSSQITGMDLVDDAMRQFSTWCTSFHSHVNAANSSLMIRIFAGDCMPFCQALRMCHMDKVTKTGKYSRPWGLSQIDFTEDYEGPPTSAPLLFNVIDTSNLTDHIGLLNLVLVSSPLLRRTPWSILQTETIGSSTPDKKLESALLDRVFCDIPTLSVLLGIAPSFHLHPFSTDCRKNDQMVMGIVESGYFYQPISWKCPFSVASYSASAYPEVQEDDSVLVCDEVPLAKFLFSVYMQMFAEENITNLANKTVSQYKINYLHYIRTSFVEFLCIVKRRVQVDWTKTMEHFIDFVEADNNLLLGMINYQDFICQLHLYDLYTIDTLRWDYVGSIRTSGDYFDGWQVVPPVVSVVLKVPRACLRVLEDSDRMDIGVPILVCETRGLNAQNMHSSIRLSFGDVVYSGQHADARVVITEDPAGWHGKSPLILSFDAASWLFTKFGNVRSVGLYARATPMFSKKLHSIVGLNQSIFSAPLNDKKHVFITRHRPDGSQATIRTKEDTTVDSGSPAITVGFNASATGFETLALRKNIVDQGAAETLASGVTVSTKIIGDTSIVALFEGYTQLFQFPFPIDASRVKTKIARKSLYIEVVASLRREDIITSLNLFPIAQSKTFFNLLNISYLNLSILPALRLPLAPGSTKSLSLHLLLTFSDQERIKQQSAAHHEENGMIINLKESISSIFLKGSGLQLPQIFGLSSPTIGAYALIFVNDFRLDLTSQTIVADACVIPLNEKNGAKVMETMNRSSKQDVITISTLDDEVRSWKLLLPAFVERCRTWQHSDLCEYLKRGIPACSMEDNWDGTTSPLCSCGLGKDLGDFADVDDLKAIRSEATRIAISPLFPLIPLQKSLANITKKEDSGKIFNPSPDANLCAQCSGLGQPKLLFCGRCKKIQYCSQTCQKAHWKKHKVSCVVVEKSKPM